MCGRDRPEWRTSPPRVPAAGRLTQSTSWSPADVVRWCVEPVGDPRRVARDLAASTTSRDRSRRRTGCRASGTSHCTKNGQLRIGLQTVDPDLPPPSARPRPVDAGCPRTALRPRRFSTWRDVVDLRRPSRASRRRTLIGRVRPDRTAALSDAGWSSTSTTSRYWRSVSGRIMLVVPKRGCTPPSMNFSPRSSDSRSVVAVSPSGPTAYERWSSRMRLILSARPVAQSAGWHLPASESAGWSVRGRRAARCALQCSARTSYAGWPISSTSSGPYDSKTGPRAVVRVGVARAVPVEVVAAGTPPASVVLGDGDLGVRRAVRELDLAVEPPDRQLPAHVGLGLEGMAGHCAEPNRARNIPRRRGTRAG